MSLPRTIDLIGSFYVAEQKAGVPLPPQELLIITPPLVSPLPLDLLLPGQQEATAAQISGRMKQPEPWTCGESGKAPGVPR